MAATDQTEAQREQLASAINGFITSVGAPSFLKVTASNIALTENGANVSAVFGDVRISVEVGKESIMHLLMIHSFLGSMGG